MHAGAGPDVVRGGLPTDEQAVGPLNAGVGPDVVLAHEALAIPGLL